MPITLPSMPSWSTTKTTSKQGVDKVYNLVDKLGAPINKVRCPCTLIPPSLASELLEEALSKERKAYQLVHSSRTRSAPKLSGPRHSTKSRTRLPAYFAASVRMDSTLKKTGMPYPLRPWVRRERPRSSRKSPRRSYERPRVWPSSLPCARAYG